MKKIKFKRKMREGEIILKCVINDLDHNKVFDALTTKKKLVINDNNINDYLNDIERELKENASKL